MAYSTPEQLSFHPVAGHTIRADFEEAPCRGFWCPLTPRHRSPDWPHRTPRGRHPRYPRPSYDHPLRDLLAQRIPIKSPPAMRTAMMPTASVAIRCLS